MNRRTRVLLLPLLLCAALLLPGLGNPASADDPTSPSAPAARAQPGSARDFSDYPCVSTTVPSICRVTRYAKRPYVVLWGDSHALMYLAPITAVAKSRRVNLVVMFSGGCPVSRPFPQSKAHPRLTCDRHNIGALDYVRKLDRAHRTRVVIGGFWHGYRVRYAAMQRERRTGQNAHLTAYERHISELGAVRSKSMFKLLGRLGIRADVISQAGLPPAGAPACREGDDPYQCDLPRAQALPAEADNARWLAERTRLLAGTSRVITASNHYCGPQTCYAHVGSANTYFDENHLGEQMTRGLKSYFTPTFDAVLRRR